MKPLLRIFALFSAFCLAPCFGANQYEAVVTITNIPAMSNSLTVNSWTRIWTTNSPSATQFRTVTNSIPYNTTNLWLGVTATKFTNNLRLTFQSTNSIRFIAQGGATLSVIATGGWASVSIITNTQTTTSQLTLPFEAEPSANTRSNNADYIIEGLSLYATGGSVLSNRILEGSAMLAGAITGVIDSASIDLTKIGNSVSGALVNTSVSAGNYGTASSVPAFGVDAHGRLTGVTNTPIVLPNYVVTNAAIDALRLNNGASLTNLPALAQYVVTNAALDALRLNNGANLTNLPSLPQYVVTNAALDALRLNNGVNLSNIPLTGLQFVPLTNLQTGVTLAGAFNGQFTGNGALITNLPPQYVLTNAALDALRLNDGGNLTNLPPANSTNALVHLIAFGVTNDAAVVIVDTNSPSQHVAAGGTSTVSIASSGGGGNSTVINTTLVANATTVVLDGFTITAGQSYRLLVNLTNAQTVADYLIHFNGDVTVDHYSREYISANGASLSSARQAASYFVAVEAGDTGSAWVDLMLDLKGRTRFRATPNEDASGLVFTELVVGKYTNQVASVTNIIIKSTVANAVSTGSQFLLVTP